MCDCELTDAELELIDSYFNRKIGSLEEVITAVTRIISEITNYTAVVVKEDMSDTITAIKLLDLSNGKMLVVIVTDARVLKDGMLEIPDEFTEQMISQAERWLNKLFVGKHVSEFLNFTYPYTLVNDEFAQFNALFKKIIDVLRKQSLYNGMDVSTYGERKTLQHAEYSDARQAQRFLAEMEDKGKIAEMFTFDGGEDGSVTVKIGASDNAPDGCSVVSARVRLGENVSGSIGVIGPVRMNYKKVLAVLDRISDIIIDLIPQGD